MVHATHDGACLMFERRTTFFPVRTRRFFYSVLISQPARPRGCPPLRGDSRAVALKVGHRCFMEHSTKAWNDLRRQAQQPQPDVAAAFSTWPGPESAVRTDDRGAHESACGRKQKGPLKTQNIPPVGVRVFLCLALFGGKNTENQT